MLRALLAVTAFRLFTTQLAYGPVPKAVRSSTRSTLI
jgi:hypothetical protein